MCITPARCFPATPLQLYSSTNPCYAGKRRGLFRVTLNSVLHLGSPQKNSAVAQVPTLPFSPLHGAITESPGAFFLDQITSLRLTITVHKQSLCPLPPKFHYFIIFSAVCSVLSLFGNQAVKLNKLLQAQRMFYVVHWIVLIFPFAMANICV